MKRTFFQRSSVGHVKEKQHTPFYYHGQREGIIQDLFTLIPQENYECFYDPFSGSGSLTFAAMNRGMASRYSMNDSISVLSCLWTLIQRYPQNIIDKYTEMATKYCTEVGHQRSLFYEKMLQKFNEDFNHKISAEAAIAFLFLINFSDKKIPLFDKNTLVTQADLFYDAQALPNELHLFVERITGLSQLLNNRPVQFSSGDFLECLNTAVKGDLVLLDPPYPLQANNIYLKLKSESDLHKSIEQTLISLRKKGVPFLVLYGARMVPLTLQFDEKQTGTHHLLRVSEHPILGRFLDHIYVSDDIVVDQLPPGMGFYQNFFKPDVEMTHETYRNALIQLCVDRDSQRISPTRHLAKL